jgi:hypothetical protein
MRERNRFSLFTLALLAVSLAAFSPAALAYLDPSTGSMVVSAIVGIFASIALALKTYWYKIKGLFKRESDEDTAPQDGSD